MFPENTILIFPQTLYWEEGFNPDKIEQAKKIFNGHKHLIICARDFVSFLLMKKSYNKCRIILAPDMVLSKDWTNCFLKYKKLDRTLICLKSDKESILLDTDKERIRIIARKKFADIYLCDTDLGKTISEENRWTELSKILCEFQKSKLVITDRLHGMLFAVITKTPCVVLDNCNHKLRYTYAWIRDIPYVEFAYNIGMIANAVESVLKVNNVEYDFAKEIYFDDLTYIIKTLVGE